MRCARSMLRLFRIESVRGRLTVYFVAAMGFTLVVVGGLIYALLARALYARVDDSLGAIVGIARTSLANDLTEGQDAADAARSTAAELSSRQLMLAIYDDGGRLLAEEGRDDDLRVVLPPLDLIPVSDTRLETVAEAGDADDRHRLGLRRVSLPEHNAHFIVVAGQSLERTDEELESLRGILRYVVPLALMAAGIGGWFLARQSLAPVADMAARARQMSAEDLSGRLVVANPRDELGRLAGTFNDLLGRLDASMRLQRQLMEAQRQFMADASHELRTPVTTTRTAANIALQQPHREEREYRETLAIVEQQATRLSRIVNDLFTLARADAGTYPVRVSPMYLDEVIDEAVAAARVLASQHGVTIEAGGIRPAPFAGDEDLIRRLIVNLLDNAVRYTGKGRTVGIDLARDSGGYALTVHDEGPGIPPDAQPHIFERFYCADRARTPHGDGGAGLGLALARWIAEVHGGSLSLVRSTSAGTTFTARLP
jgi:heavy metal sensor kinase